MKVFINSNGLMIIYPESHTEEYALKKWQKEQGGKVGFDIALEIESSKEVGYQREQRGV